MIDFELMVVRFGRVMDDRCRIDWIRKRRSTDRKVSRDLCESSRDSGRTGFVAGTSLFSLSLSHSGRRRG